MGLKSVKDNCACIVYLLKQYLKFGKGVFISHLIVSVLIAPLGPILILILEREIIDRIVEGNTFVSIAVLIVAFQVVFSMLDFIEHLINVSNIPKEAAITDKLNKMIIEKAIKTDLIHFNNPEFYNNFNWSLSYFAKNVEYAKDIFMRFVFEFVTIMGITTFVAMLDPVLIIVVIVAVVLSIVIQMFHAKVSVDTAEGENFPERVLGYIRRIFYDPNNAAELKSNRISEFLSKKYDYASNERNKVITKNAPRNLVWATLGSSTYYAFYGIVGISLVFRIINGNLSIGSVIVLLHATQKLQGRLTELLSIFKETYKVASLSKRIKIFNETVSNIEHLDDISGELFEDFEEGACAVELRDVHFGYNNDPLCLRGVNMTVTKGEKIAIVGENGVGKTTFAKLLLRLYDVNAGKIIINGKPIEKYRPKELRQKIGIAFQKPFIYALTLAENLQLYGEADYERIKAAMVKAGLKNVLENAANGLDTDMTKEFSENGIILSGGQEQKLALSRLLVGNLGLMILDEPSSALDPLAEQELSNLIFNASHGATTIFISHRLSSVKNADKIYLFDDGVVAESGTHEELMRLEGKYCVMFNTQAEGYIEGVLNG